MPDSLPEPTRDQLGTSPPLARGDSVPGIGLRPTGELIGRILETVPAGIAQIDRDELIGYVNREGQRLLEFTFAEPGKHTLRDFEERTLWEDGSPCPVDQYPASQCLRAGKATGPATIGVRGKSGEIFWGVFSAIPLFDDGSRQPSGVVVSFLDITQRKNAEETLRQTEDRYRRLVEKAPDAIVVHHDERFVYVNDAAVELWGVQSPHDLLGHAIFEAVHPEDRDAARKRVRQVVENKVSTALASVRLLRKDGSVAHTEVTGTPCIYEGVPSVQAIFRDITERTRAEQALREAKAELELRVAQRTEELSRKNDELQKEIAEHRRTERKLQEKQQFLQQMLNVHERNQQLVAYEIHDTFVQDVIGALMFLDAFHSRKFTDDDPDWEGFTRAGTLLRKAIDEARRMISDLRPPIIDEQGIAAAIEYLISELQSRGCTIEFQHSMRVGRLPPLLEATIFRIVQEALINLERHSGADQGQVKLTQEDHTIRLVVSDRGAGFDPEQVAEGHFGLQGIKERTRLLGGNATIRSVAGLGTDVIVELPLAEDD